MTIELRKIRSDATHDVYAPFWKERGERWSFDHVAIERVIGKSYGVFDPCLEALGLPETAGRYVPIPSEEPGCVAAVLEFDVPRPHSFADVVEVPDD